LDPSGVNEAAALGRRKTPAEARNKGRIISREWLIIPYDGVAWEQGVVAANEYCLPLARFSTM